LSDAIDQMGNDILYSRDARDRHFKMVIAILTDDKSAPEDRKLSKEEKKGFVDDVKRSLSVFNAAVVKPDVADYYRRASNYVERLAE